MSNLDDARHEAEARLLASRRAVEERLAEVKSAVEGTIGFVPRNAALLLALVAGAGGFALALRRRRNRRRRIG